jgi:hypothetical protein
VAAVVVKGVLALRQEQLRPGHVGVGRFRVLANDCIELGTRGLHFAQLEPRQCARNPVSGMPRRELHTALERRKGFAQSVRRALDLREVHEQVRLGRKALQRRAHRVFGLLEPRGLHEDMRCIDVRRCVARLQLGRALERRQRFVGAALGAVEIAQVEPGIAIARKTLDQAAQRGDCLLALTGVPQGVSQHQVGTRRVAVETHGLAQRLGGFREAAGGECCLGDAKLLCRRGAARQATPVVLGCCWRGVRGAR